MEVQKIKTEIKKAFVGKDDTIETLLIGFLSGLSVLIEDIPGVGKTTLAKSLAAAAGLDFGRIQFTPDLLPGDIIGMTIWDQEKQEFIFKEGAIMHQFVLADEINRASARTQSALLEAMQEQTVTVDGTTYRLPDPFFVAATQNPSRYAGTFQLPEAQLDRFGLSLSIGYPDHDAEIAILDKINVNDPFAVIKPVTTPDEVSAVRKEIEGLFTDPKVKTYLTRIATATRNNAMVNMGMSPRATLHLLTAAKSRAFIRHREFVLPEDVTESILPVLQHKLLVSPEARMENRSVPDIIQEIISDIPLPTGIA